MSGSALGLEDSHHHGHEDSDMNELVNAMDRLCDGGLDVEPAPKWLQLVRTNDKSELARYRRRVMTTTRKERAERFHARDDRTFGLPLAQLDAYGRPSLRGVIPSRSFGKCSHVPRRETISNKVIKSWEKVKSSRRYRRSRPNVRIQGFAPPHLSREQSSGAEGDTECFHQGVKRCKPVVVQSCGILFVGGFDGDRFM